MLLFPIYRMLVTGAKGILATSLEKTNPAAEIGGAPARQGRQLHIAGNSHSRASRIAEQHQV